MSDTRLVGHVNKCPRGYINCTSVGLIASTDSFVCAGVLNTWTDKGSLEPGATHNEQDKFKHCWYTEDLDMEIEMDETDMLHASTVMLQALSFTNAF